MFKRLFLKGKEREEYDILNNNKLSDYSKELKIFELDDHTKNEKDIFLLNLDHKYKKVSEEDYEYKSLDLKYSGDSKLLSDYKLQKNELDYKYKKFDEYKYELNKLEILNDKKDVYYKKEVLELKKKFNKISDIEYMKNIKDLDNKPFVMINTKSTDDESLEIEVEHNKTFLKKVRDMGLPGTTDDELIEQWLRLFFISNLTQADINDIIENENQVSFPNTMIKYDDLMGNKESE